MTAPGGYEERMVQPLYEREELATVTGGPLRPGGLELTRKLLDHSGLLPGDPVLDLGCGSGFSLELMTRAYNFVTIGMDPSSLLLDQAARRVPEANLLRATANALPCIDGFFAALVCECVLSLTGDIRQTVREMHRVLRTGGMVLLSDVYSFGKESTATFVRTGSCVDDTADLAAVTQTLDASGFEMLHFWECTDALKQLAGQIIFDYGSLAGFWNVVLGLSPGQCAFGCRQTGKKLGYYALIARKR
ncbi:MAG: class I SAM-dependent methyltransferase [Desulfobulbus sp.]|nr:class I SAM-dependent methyltransferase [Desulfobulbus sp.]